MNNYIVMMQIKLGLIYDRDLPFAPVYHHPEYIIDQQENYRRYTFTLKAIFKSTKN